MIEENAVAREQSIPLTVVHRCPVCVQLRTAIGAARPKGRSLGLRSLDRFAVHFATRCLIKFGLDSRFPNSFQQADGAQRGDIAGVFRDLKAH